MNELGRAAPAGPGVPEVNVNQSHSTPPVSDSPRSMPTWRRGFYQEVSDEQRLLESLGGPKPVFLGLRSDKQAKDVVHE